jgi:hypothetical protein
MLLAERERAKRDSLVSMTGSIERRERWRGLSCALAIETADHHA